MDVNLMPIPISWTYALIILGLCAIINVHMIVTLWTKRREVQYLNPHHPITHSIPMTLGMIAAFALCTTGGAVMSSHLGLAYTLGFLIGMLVGGLIGWPFRIAATLEGIVAGVMGGLMGIMIGSMVPAQGLYSIGLLLTALFAVSWAFMWRHLIDELEKSAAPRSSSRHQHGS